MPSRKRTHAEAAAPAVAPVQKEPNLVDRIRNMWQFANLCQWIFTFGKVVKFDDSVDAEMLEMECLKPGTPGLKDLGLRLLQFLSSHRGLNLELFDEYTRRQYLSKAPELNPFGDQEVAASFSDFDVFQKIKVLQQLTVFAMIYSDKLREKTEENDQTQWRIEPYGWDGDDRTYFLLDDNRLYRQTEPAPPPPPVVKPSKKTKAGRASLRKRRRTTAGSVDDGDEDSFVHEQEQTEREPADNGIGGRKWECIAVTLDHLTAFLDSLRKSRDDNEKILRKRLEENLLPIMERQDASRKRKEQAHERELLNMAKMANAKRSTRLAGKAEQQRHEQQIREEEAKRQSEEAKARKREVAALKEQQRITMDREQRLQSRQDRLQERQTRRIQHEEELARLSDSEHGSSAGRLSQRHLKAEIEKNQLALQQLEGLDDDWIFDCVCGVYGQVDDGTHSISCERCNTWQHSACLGISEQEADASDFNYVCQTCRRREEDETAERSRPTIKLKLGNGSLSRTSLDTASKDAASDDTEPSTPTAESSTNHDGQDATDVPALSQASRESFAKNATLFPPPSEAPGGLPVIPVKKSGRPSTGSLPRPILTDITTTSLQTPASVTRTVNPLSSSPPMKLAPATTSSPYLGPSKANGSPTALPAVLATPVDRKGGSFDHQRGFPPSTPLGGSSPTGSFSMAPLPPSEHGISPTKHTPPPQPRASQNGANGVDGSSPSGSASVNRKLATQSAIVPPATTLVPSPPPQITTPPRKHMSPAVRP